MKYKRPTFMEPGVPVFETNFPYGNAPMVLPVFETPITPKENFIRAGRRDNPLWVPNVFTDSQDFNPCELATHKLGKFEAGPDFRRGSKENYTFLDPWENSWTWEATAQGAMLTPGTKLLEDITDWEKVIKWQNLEEWTYREVAEKFMAEKHNPDKALSLELFQGATEMLVAFLGGYGEGMIAMAEEPEAVTDFFNCFVDEKIKFFDYLNELYPIDMVTYHDDWGTQRSTFFSPKMFDELVYEPTKRLVDHVHSKGVMFQLHSCGNIEAFMPQIVDIGFDYLQIQRNALDIPTLKKLYGDQIGFDVTIEGHVPNTQYTEEQMVEFARNCVDIYAKGGGYFPFILEFEPKALWAFASELHCYSREFYDKEQGRA